MTTGPRRRYVRWTLINLLHIKKAMLAQAENLKDEASEWAWTYKILMQEMNDRIIDLEADLIGAELDRMVSDDSNFGLVGWIH
jgi:hypothetical protein